jgi:hypothetical protein
MNSQRQRRTDRMLRHVCRICAMVELYCSCLRLPAPSANAEKLICCHKHVAEELSAYRTLWPTGHQRQLKPIQLP